LALKGNPVQDENRQQLEFWKERVRAGSQVLDVGAFVGVFSLVAASRCGGSGRVIAFEPSAQAAALLRANARLNRLERRIAVVESAVGSAPGRATYFCSGLSSENTLRSREVHESAGRTCEEREVEVVSLDTFIEANGVTPDLVKIDVEGYELEVLRGMRALLRSPAIVLCEMHPHLWSGKEDTAGEIQALLWEAGRSIYSLAGLPAEIRDFGAVVLARGDALAG